MLNKFSVPFKRLLGDGLNHAVSVRISPDCSKVAAGDLSGKVFVWSLTGDKALPHAMAKVSVDEETSDGHARTPVCWMPDSAHLIAGSGDGKVKEFDADDWNGAPSEVLVAKGRRITCIDVAKGRVLAGCDDGSIVSVDMNAAATAATVKDLGKLHAGPVCSLSWSSDGLRFASVGDDKEAFVIEAANTWVRRIDPLLGRSAHSVRWSPDGDRFAIAAGSAEVYDVRTGVRQRTLGRNVLDLDWSPDNRRIATAHADGNIRVWDATTGQAVRVLRSHESQVHSISWSADGSVIASAAKGKADAVRVWLVRDLLSAAAASSPSDTKHKAASRSRTPTPTPPAPTSVQPTAAATTAAPQSSWGGHKGVAGTGPAPAAAATAATAATTATAASAKHHRSE
jgi:WD40 repeat protein